MILGEIISIYPLMNQLNLYIGIVVDQVKFYLENLNEQNGR
jgi:hypothetical protein